MIYCRFCLSAVSGCTPHLFKGKPCFKILTWACFCLLSCPCCSPLPSGGGARLYGALLGDNTAEQYGRLTLNPCPYRFGRHNHRTAAYFDVHALPVRLGASDSYRFAQLPQPAPCMALHCRVRPLSNLAMAVLWGVVWC